MLVSIRQRELQRVYRNESAAGRVDRLLSKNPKPDQLRRGYASTYVQVRPAGKSNASAVTEGRHATGCLYRGDQPARKGRSMFNV